MLYDFHTHTFLSDGVLLPMELIRRYAVKGCRVMGITDHAGPSTLERVIKEVRADAANANKYWDIAVLTGVELTHCPPEIISELAKEAKALGADLVVVHGESIVEPVPEGTNRAAVSSPDVDILAHPGLLTEDDARLAAKHGVALELSRRNGHCLTNGHVARLGLAAGALLVVNSDSHAPGDLLDEKLQYGIARGAGLTGEQVRQVLDEAPHKLLEKLGK